MFETIIGNKPIKDLLERATKKEMTSHSYLFVGIQGIGKKKLAIEFAKKLLCIQKEQEEKCKSCIEFDSQNHPDFMKIEPEGNRIKIEQIRFLQNKIQEKPIIANKKVYIIDEADKMTTEAQNCLLKTLEEPPEYTTLILIGSHENAFLPTIKSRCLILYFQPIPDEEIKQYLETNYGLTNITKDHLTMFQGSIGKAIRIKDKQTEWEEINTIIYNLKQNDLIETIKQAEVLYKAKDEIFEILDYMNGILLDQAKEDIRYANCIEIVEDTKKRWHQNANYDMCIDYLVFNMWEQVR